MDFGESYCGFSLVECAWRAEKVKSWEAERLVGRVGICRKAPDMSCSRSGEAYAGSTES